MKTRQIIPVTALALLATVACNKESKESSETPAPAPKVSEPAKPSANTPTAGLAEAVGTYKLDPGHSAVSFKAVHMNVSHTLGRFNKVEGSLVVGKTPAESSVTIEVAAASVFTADKKRDEHLKGPDFLNVAQYPTIKFASTKVEAAGDNRYKVTGDLTLHGVTKQVSAAFEHVGAGKNMMNPKMFLTGFTGQLVVKRSDYGMKNMMGAVGDDIELVIAVEGIRQ